MEQVQEATDQARQKVQEAGGQAKQRARQQVDERSTQAGERVSDVAGDARSVAEELRKQGKDRPAELAEQAAQRAERVGGYLQESDADRILRDVEDFGRRQPWAVVAGGLALGFMASRFLKASSRDRYEASRHHTTGNGHSGNGSPPRQELVSQQLAETPPATVAPRGPVDELAPRS